ncbi:hypothetical protein [Marmoricola endophyticus]|nr:hypothetical protein [Marmoricola endophyticus]
MSTNGAADAWSIARSRSAVPLPEPDCPARHCWVSDPADGSRRVRRPGLLLEWRRTPSGWEGRVAYAAQLREGRWALVEEWVPAASLTRV